MEPKIMEHKKPLSRNVPHRPAVEQENVLRVHRMQVRLSETEHASDAKAMTAPAKTEYLHHLRRS